MCNQELSCGLVKGDKGAETLLLSKCQTGLRGFIDALGCKCQGGKRVIRFNFRGDVNCMGTH